MERTTFWTASKPPRRSPMRLLAGGFALVVLIWAGWRSGAWAWQHLFHRAGKPGGEEPASVIVAGPEPAALGTTLSLRKKLDSKPEMHFSKGRLEEILGWVGEQIDLPIVYQVDLSSLEPITVKSEERPLYAILSDVLARRNLAFVLQRDSVVIIACKQNAVTSETGGKRQIAYEIEAEVLGLMNEPAELYCGDRGQHRLRLIAGPSASRSREVKGMFDLQYSLYENDDLAASGAVSGVNDEWINASLQGMNGRYLRLRPSTEDGIDLALGVQFRYGVTEAAP